MSPATERVLAEGLTCSKQSFVSQCIWSIVAALGTSFLIAGESLPLILSGPSRHQTVGDDLQITAPYLRKRIGPAVEQSVTGPPHFGRT